MPAPPRRPLVCLLLAAAADPVRSSYAHRPGALPRGSTSTSLRSARLPGAGDPGPTGGRARRAPGGRGGPPSKPAWQENLEYWADREELERLNREAGGGKTKKEQSFGKTVGSVYNDGGNTFAHLYKRKTTDQFKRPYEYQEDEEEEHVVAPIPPPPPRRVDSQTLPPPPRRVDSQTLPPPHTQNGAMAQGEGGWVPDWFGGNKRMSDDEYRQLPQSPQNEPPPVPPNPRAIFDPNAHRHSFQSSTTDDFKKPYGMPDAASEKRRRSTPHQIKAPFQMSTTEDFKRSSDVSSGVGAPQQPIYQQPQMQPRSENAAWKNAVGRDVYGSTQDPGRGGVMDAMIVESNPRRQHRQPQHHQPFLSQSAVPTTEFDQYDRPSTRASRSSSSSNTMLRPIRWPRTRDPPGVAPDHPSVVLRALSVALATTSTWYLHTFRGVSPVLASSATTMLTSACVDRRLGRAALCGALAGMAGGRLVPDPAMAAALGALTWICYEVLIRINDLSAGMGGRAGATAFLAASILAKRQGVRVVGRKMRRGVWGASGPSGLVMSMILYHALGSVSTILLREASDVDSATADPVKASSAVGLLGSLFVRDPVAVLAVYGGSLVGMSSPSQLMNRGVLPRPRSAASVVASFAGAGAMAGFIHAVSVHWGYWSGGWGGKVGLCALLGCWMYRGLGDVARFAKRRA